VIIRHIGITVEDMEKSLGFYRDLLGFVITRDMKESGECIDNFSGIKNILVRTVKMKDADDNLIELLQYYSHPEKAQRQPIITIGCSHFAITVEDLDGLYAKLKSKGILFNAPPQFSPDGKVKLTFCKDPDGVLIEMVEVLK
jgi:glyoxylase I family protein